MAPLTESTELGVNSGRHEWWIELQPGTVDTHTGSNIAEELDSRLQEAHEVYKMRRWEGNLGPPYVRLVMPGAFEHWLRHNNLWGGPHKLPIARNDRRIADGLSKMARFQKIKMIRCRRYKLAWQVLLQRSNRLAVFGVTWMLVRKNQREKMGPPLRGFRRALPVSGKENAGQSSDLMRGSYSERSIMPSLR